MTEEEIIKKSIEDEISDIIVELIDKTLTQAEEILGADTWKRILQILEP